MGAFIFLVQAEIIAALSLLATGQHDTGMQEVPADIRQSIAAHWLDYFDGAS
ncbi:hypothetical protein OG320_23615 [Microbispora sp. NBC_01189]|uniref:hypothetical protein n=1 Tax=Microbispora sp. NBC_01189 TaxID=2903583 RepID=UPI002E14C869|nr:hypothetical protein OG320_23615 [Microbispora sp. NBC_01189]